MWLYVPHYQNSTITPVSEILGKHAFYHHISKNKLMVNLWMLSCHQTYPFYNQCPYKWPWFLNAFLLSLNDNCECMSAEQVTFVKYFKTPYQRPFVRGIQQCLIDSHSQRDSAYLYQNPTICFHIFHHNHTIWKLNLIQEAYWRVCSIHFMPLAFVIMTLMYFFLSLTTYNKNIFKLIKEVIDDDKDIC